VIEGALLRLRPKVMTVSTVIAGLLPIMWSTRTGAEIMKPIATPVLGGMVSSLLHVLVVTPVIFFWLRARQLPVEIEGSVTSTGVTDSEASSVRWKVFTAGVVIGIVALVAVWVTSRAQWMAPASQIVQTVTAGNIHATLRSESGTLARGHNRFWIDFEDTSGRRLDAGDVRLSATMPMPGMVMSGGVEVERTAQMGRYIATGDFGMSGVWQMTLQWEGPAGRGSTSFQGRVQ
jgi:Cu(I)/Ag(I) efflux system membrane protein CusA/SilA